jgi:hypothetical protein
MLRRYKEELECALVIQMACTHTATMAVLARLDGVHGGDRNVDGNLRQLD